MNVLFCVLFGLLFNAGCTLTARRTAVVDDYEPMYYESRVVYFDTWGEPYYYNGGVVVYVPRTYPRYNVYVTYHRQHRTGYRNWREDHGPSRRAPANNRVRQNRPAPASNAGRPAPRGAPGGDRRRR
ncbi:MAG: hypothetical protein P1V97_03320 [Planctomycetota bacterium]|nr:hypothetical protein [Planctomycetota bacterium]